MITIRAADLLNRGVWLLIECLEMVEEPKSQAKRAVQLPCKPDMMQELTKNTNRRIKERLKCLSRVVKEH
jgi:hypothetical protein